MIEKHPYQPFLNADTKFLIIGTCPPMRFTQQLEFDSEDVDFFYGSCDNYFWELVCEVFDVDLPWENSDGAVKKRESLFSEHSIGLLDIVQEFRRRDNNASDDNLEVIKYTDLIPILEKNKGIDRIAFTGGATEKMVNHYLDQNDISNTIVSNSPPKEKEFKIQGRTIRSYTMYSPSPRAIAVKGYDVVLRQYKTILGDL